MALTEQQKNKLTALTKHKQKPPRSELIDRIALISFMWGRCFLCSKCTKYDGRICHLGLSPGEYGYCDYFSREEGK
uniref:PML-orf2 n=1 Tax=Methanohalophilus mahii TaxID=2176 RepID=Q6QWE6_9EURY|nr:pML-orf2 [Methanohalophilus mahii]